MPDETVPCRYVVSWTTTYGGACELYFQDHAEADAFYLRKLESDACDVKFTESASAGP